MISFHRRQFLGRSACSFLGLASFPWAVASRTASAMMLDEPAVDPAKTDLIYRSRAPRNGEPRLSKLAENWVTPTPQFYIRSHGPNPAVTPDEFTLSIDGLVEKPLVLSIADLIANYPASSCTCTMSCAGIRRREFIRIKPMKGVDWAEGPIGNAVWSGVRLSEVLKSAGILSEAKHIWFEGADQVIDGSATFPFGASIPLSKLQEEDATMPGALLATQMNGAALLPDHGAPIRCIVPGYIGARSVKWLRKITLSDKPSTNHFVADVYKMVYSQSQPEIDETAPIYRHSINAALCSATRTDRGYSLRGYALATGRKGCTLTSVQLSTDGGTSWIKADLGKEAGEFCWQLWTATLAVAGPETEICVRATDSLGNTMPQTVPWNPKGYLYNAWHRIAIRDVITN